MTYTGTTKILKTYFFILVQVVKHKIEFIFEIFPKLIVPLLNTSDSKQFQIYSESFRWRQRSTIIRIDCEFKKNREIGDY